MPCVFCGAKNKLSREHILPDWLNDELGIRGTERNLATVVHGGYPGRSRHRTAIGFDMKVKAVCERCNNGWLSLLENEGAKPHLVPLVHGVPHRLDIAAQRVLATWAAKTALVTQAKHSKRLRSHFDSLYDGQHPPRQTQVWIGAYREGALQDLSGFLHHDLQIVFDPAEWNPHVVNGYGTTIFVRHVLFQVIGLELAVEVQRTLKGVLGGALTKIWPPTRPVPWPPRIIIDEANLQVIADSVIPGVMPENPPPEMEAVWEPVSTEKDHM